MFQYPREKFIEKGIDNLSDMDLIAILVGSGTRDLNFLSISRTVMRKIQRLVSSGSIVVSLEDLTCIKGVGSVVAMRIIAGIELGRRLYCRDSKQKIIIKNSEDAYKILKYMGSKKQEHIVALFLNSRFELLGKKTIGIGSLDFAGIEPRDVIIPALDLNSAHVVIAHNHPSGNSSPSDEDLIVNERLRQALDMVGLNLLDHLVISSDSWKNIS